MSDVVEIPFIEPLTPKACNGLWNDVSINQIARVITTSGFAGRHLVSGVGRCQMLPNFCLLNRATLKDVLCFERTFLSVRQRELLLLPAWLAAILFPVTANSGRSYCSTSSKEYIQEIMCTDIILREFLPGTEFMKDILQKYTASGFGRNVYRKQE
jgi:hypothetical protein